MAEALPNGIVYTDTVVHTAPERYVSEAPYQIAIVDLGEQHRVTARILGERVQIGDAVQFSEWRAGVPYFTKA